MIFRGVTWWRSRLAYGALVGSAFLALHAGTDMVGAMERHFYDFASTANQHQPSDQIALIAIDDQSLASLGPWPWPRDIHARLLAKLAVAGPKVVVETVPFLEPQPDHGLSFIQRIQTVLSAQPVTSLQVTAQGNAALQQQLYDIVGEAATALDGDAQLGRSLQQAGNVLLAATGTFGGEERMTDTPLPPSALKSAVEEAAGMDLASVQVQAPIDQLGLAAMGVGHISWRPDVDGLVRSEPLLVSTHGKALPSLALLAVASSMNLKASDIHVVPGPSLLLGGLKIAMSASGTILPQFYKSVHGAPAFTPDSFNDVLTGKIAADKYGNKIVIIGVTAAGIGKGLAVPGNPSMSPLEALAQITSSISQAHVAYQPAWAIWVTWVAMALTATYVVLGLPALSFAVAAGSSLALFSGLLVVEFWWLSARGLWVPLVLPAALLLLGYVAQMLRHILLGRPVGVMSVNESPDTHRMMGLALQGQGQLDMAFERFRRTPIHAALAQDLYWLAMDFERKQLFGKAQAVYEHIAGFDDDYKDVKVRLERAKAFAGNESRVETLTAPCEQPAQEVKKVTLGRYQVEKELGKGAMGEVYLGKDPKIGRWVALKTMALSHEFDGSDLIDARERFFREAKAAGRLQHPCIVTIFDVGEERDLAYIAMEYLKGRDLQLGCKPGQLMPVPRVLSIVARVALALSYAHGQQVIHRDIKPSNVMYDIVTDTVKVTDFGIAHVTDAHKTRTGVVMGTPSYMSPEQLAGLTLDGRTDLYSLGVMTFQLLTGVLPFRADSVAELMFKIAKEPAPDVRQIRPKLPESLAKIVAGMLSKAPQNRYQDGQELATELSNFSRRTRGGALPPLNTAVSDPQAMHVDPIDLKS